MTINFKFQFSRIGRARCILLLQPIKLNVYRTQRKKIMYSDIHRTTRGLRYNIKVIIAPCAVPEKVPTSVFCCSLRIYWASILVSPALYL